MCIRDSLRPTVREYQISVFIHFLPAIAAIRKLYEPQIPIAVFRLGIVPVSYTHLDVYKRQVLIHQIESGLYERQAIADKISNFESRLASPQSELAVQTFIYDIVSEIKTIGNFYLKIFHEVFL